MTAVANPDPAWRATVPGLVAIHQIDSTAVPGLPAKRVLDLIRVYQDNVTADAARDTVEVKGYEWMATFGRPGQCYCRRSDGQSNIELLHAHAHGQGLADIRRHPACRDALCANAGLHVAYISVKAACAARHPDLGAGYAVCKSEWITKTEARALENFS